MKTKLFPLCLMAALCFPLMAYCQYYDDDVEIVEEVVTEDWDPLQKTIDSLRELSMDYYKDLSHWDIFIEPSVTVQEDTAFDPAGMKHAYFVRRFYFIAVPHASDFRYQPQVAGPYLHAYGQKMPIEAQNAQQLQMIRKAVFPFAASFSANTPSRTIFQQYVERNFDKDYQYVVDSLIAWKISHLDKYEFKDTTPSSDENSVEISQKNERITVITSLTDEYAKAAPHSTITKAPAREPIASDKSLEQLKKMAVKKQNNVYLLPANAILNQIANEPDMHYYYYYGYDENDAYESIIEGMTITRYPNYEDDELYYKDGYYFEATDPTSVVSGQSYFMLNNNAVLLFPEEYYESDPYDENPYFIEKRNRYDYYDGEKLSDTILIIYPDRIEKMTLKECYEACLKDTNCKFASEFPPYLKVFVSDDLYDEDYYYNCKECYTKSAILEHLNEGSILYDYFAKDFYKNDLTYTDSKSIGYAPNYYRYFDDYDYDYEYDDVESEGADTVYFSKEQSQQIRKLLKKRQMLLNQEITLFRKAIMSGMNSARSYFSQMPTGQIYATKKPYDDSWNLEGDNPNKEVSYDDNLIEVAVDYVDEAASQSSKKNKTENKIDKLQAKAEKIEEQIRRIDLALEEITGRPLYLPTLY